MEDATYATEEFGNSFFFENIFIGWFLCIETSSYDIHVCTKYVIIDNINCMYK